MDVHELDADLLAELLPLLILADVRLWLVADAQVPEELARLLAEWPTTVVDQEAFTAHWRDRVPDDTAGRGTGDAPS